MDFEKPGPWCGFSLDGSYRALSLCACTCVCVCVCVCVSFDQINVNGASFMGFCGTCFLQYSTLPERCKNGALVKLLPSTFNVSGFFVFYYYSR